MHACAGTEAPAAEQPAASMGGSVGPGQLVVGPGLKPGTADVLGVADVVFKEAGGAAAAAAAVAAVPEPMGSEAHAAGAAWPACHCMGACMMG